MFGSIVVGLQFILKFSTLKLHHWEICEPEVQGQNLACTEPLDSYIRAAAEQVSLSEMRSQTTKKG